MVSDEMIADRGLTGTPMDRDVRLAHEYRLEGPRDFRPVAD